ncbi:NTP transferase domain-containing protein [Paenibacillus sp. CC-CFT747]|nr:NTP transferase domain-containing protein [Paenibacillus sp. CC-CFT747]
MHAVADEPPGIGPLGGLGAGLRHTAHRLNLAAAADMPFPSAALARELFAAAEGTGRPAAAVERDGRLEPLFAVYSADSLESLQAYVREGGRRIGRWLESLAPAVVPEERLRELDPAGLALFNMNRPEDYRQALLFLQAERNGHPGPASS